MSTQTRTFKVLGIVLSVTLAFSGIGTAFATQGGSSGNSPLPSVPSAEDTGELEGSATPEQSPSGENKDAGFSDGTKTPGSATNEALTGETGENGSEDSDIGIGSDKDVAGVAIAAGAATQASLKAGEVTITSESQLEGIFPDPTLRAIVFGAVKNGVKGAKGTDVWDALANFTGNIDAMGPYAGKPGHGMDLIKKAEGIQYLRNAGTVDIRFNNIEDLSFAAQEQPGPNEDPAEGTKNKWYGGGSEEGPNPHNVTWHIAGNPLRTIPEYFGGRMVIEQPAAWFSHYANDNEIHSYVRGDGDDLFSGTLQIGRVKYSGPDKKDQFVEIDNIKDSAKSNPLRTSLDTDNDTMQFSGLVKSGKHTIIVGTGTIFNYDTEAYNVIDDVWAITPGSQSFKYYTSPTFYVYDKVKLEQTTFQGSVELTKTDASNNTTLLAGAEYSLYKEGSSAPLKERLTTNANGKLTVSGLDGGSYYFVETKAPDGYLINTQPISFTIDISHTTLGGGKKTIDNLEGGASVTADEGEVFIAGPEDGDYSPDIELTLDAGIPDEVDSVEVTYSKLEQGNAASGITRSFDTLQAAQNDINSEKNANRIVGPVSIKVNYKQGGAAPDQVTVSATNAKQEKIEVSGTKTWVDNKGWTGERPAATIHLLRDGKDTGKKTTLPKSTSDQTSGTYKFTNLEKYDPTDGHEYQYTVKEDPVYITYKDPGTGFEDTQAYIPSYSGPNGTDITNTWPDGTRINIKGKKLWDDFNNADGKRPGSVTLELWQSESGGTSVLYNTTTATAADNWEYHFELVPKFVKDADGKETDKRYEYTVKEIPVEGYEKCAPLTVDTSGVNDKQDSLGNDLTNTFINDIVEVSGTKAWKNDTSADRPASVTVELLQNGKPFIPAKTQEATSAGDWKYTFTGLPKYDAAGQEYVYTVHETKVPDGYSQEIGTAKNGYAIMNTRIPLIDIPVKKVWKDNADYTGGHRAVTIRLLQNGVEIDHVELSETSPTSWSHTFKGLPKTDAAGKEYRYTVTEDLVTAPDGRPGYKTTITGDPAGGFTVTNEWTKEDLITISGKKVWEGDDAIVAKERPDHVVLVLYRDGVEYSHTTATASGNWEYSFTSLPKHQDADPAKESVYTIEEESVDGYLGDIPEITLDEVKNANNGDTIGNKDVTNVFNNNVVTVSGVKQWVGDIPAVRPESVTVELLQNGRVFKTGTAAATTIGGIVSTTCPNTTPRAICTPTQ